MRAHGAEHLPEEACVRSSMVDAVVAVGEVSLELARELDRFEPCGYGNPGVNLLVPGAQLMGMQGMGEGGKHLRLQVADASAHCGAVAWGRGGDAESLHVGARHDVVCRLEVNDWRGALAPRLVLRDIVPWPEREPVEPAPAARLGVGLARRGRRRGDRPPRARRARRPGRGGAGRARGQRPAGRRARGRRRAPPGDAARPPPLRRPHAADLLAPRRPGGAGAVRSRPSATASSQSPTTTASRASQSCASAPRTCSCSIRPRTPRSSPRSRAPARQVQIAAAEPDAVFARACVEADALRAVMAVLWRAAAQDARDAARGAARPGRLARRPAARRPRRRRARGARRERRGGGHRRAACASSRWPARATSRPRPRTPCTRAGARARWRGSTRSWPGAPRTRPPRRSPPGRRRYDEGSDVDSGTHPAPLRRAAPAPGRRAASRACRRRRRPRHRRHRARRRLRGRAPRRPDAQVGRALRRASRWASRASAPSCAPRPP